MALYVQNTDTLNQYIFKTEEETINVTEFEKALNMIIPTNDSILNENKNKNNYKNLNEVNSFLFKYNIDYDDLTYNNVKSIYNTLLKNNKVKKTKLKINYDLGKDSNYIDKRQQFSMINNFIMDILVPYYGKYPFFNNKLDSEIERLKWINSKPDNGLLFYKTNFK